MKEKIHIINNKYISEDCVQIMIRYINSLSIKLNQEDIFFEYNYNDIFGKFHSGIYNTYEKDSRRHLFPYSKIPIHKKGKYKYVNVILDFDKVYTIKLGDFVYYLKVLRYKNKAILYSCEDKEKTNEIEIEDLNIKKAKRIKDPIIRQIYNKEIDRKILKDMKNFIYSEGLLAKREEDLSNLEKKYDDMNQEPKKENENILQLKPSIKK